ncbi:MAG: polyphenol oxidase family protein [Candidatus Wenzhouxiangella sp. M2_3B_020]
MSEWIVAAPFAAPVQGGTVRSDAETRTEALGRLRPLRQVHGARCIHLDDWRPGIEADAAWTDRPGQPASIRTADCLPVLVADPGGDCVAAIHAGWRGLARGVIAETVGALPVAAFRLAAWIGPRICRDHYEVGPELRDAFPGHADAFRKSDGDRYLADLPAIATAQLRACGIGRIEDSGRCTFADDGLESVRRDGQSAGRMTTLIRIASG